MGGFWGKGRGQPWGGAPWLSAKKRARVCTCAALPMYTYVHTHTAPPKVYILRAKLRGRTYIRPDDARRPARLAESQRLFLPFLSSLPPPRTTKPASVRGRKRRGQALGRGVLKRNTRRTRGGRKPTRRPAGQNIRDYVEGDTYYMPALGTPPRRPARSDGSLQTAAGTGKAASRPRRGESSPA